LRTRGYVASLRQAYVEWVRRYILFHGKRHPQEMGAAEVAAFLEHLDRQEPASLFHLAEARSALVFLHEVVLGRRLGELPTRVGTLGGVLAETPRFLDQLRHALRVRHYRPSTEDCYVEWARRFILFHGQRHPVDLGAREVEAFLTHLAVQGHVAASTQNQALCALVSLYKRVLEIDLGRMRFGPATRPARLPVVLSRDEVRRELGAVEGAEGLYRVMADLLYGAGLRRSECCGLRVQDLDLDRRQILLRAAKGEKDRVVMLPRKLCPAILDQIDARRVLHERDLARGVARVELPYALERKYPNASRELGWQFLFASPNLSRDPRTGRVGRHHLHEAALQRAVALDLSARDGKRRRRRPQPAGPARRPQPRRRERRRGRHAPPGAGRLTQAGRPRAHPRRRHRPRGVIDEPARALPQHPLPLRQRQEVQALLLGPGLRLARR
jgi:integron integrase